MSVEGQLRKLAGELAEHAQHRESRLEREIFDLEAQVAKKRTERETACRALQRLADFQVEIGGDYQCPKCWIEAGIRSPLRPLAATDRGDLFRCRKCGFEFAARDRK